MKKLISVFILVSLAFFAQSCTHTCTCVDPNGKVSEFDIDLSDNCSDRSGSEFGECTG